MTIAQPTQQTPKQEKTYPEVRANAQQKSGYNPNEDDSSAEELQSNAGTKDAKPNPYGKSATPQ